MLYRNKVVEVLKKQIAIRAREKSMRFIEAEKKGCYLEWVQTFLER